MGRIFDQDDMPTWEGEPQEYEPRSHIVKAWHIELAEIAKVQRCEPHSPAMGRIFISVMIHGLTPKEYEDAIRCERLLAANDEDVAVWVRLRAPPGASRAPQSE